MPSMLMLRRIFKGLKNFSGNLGKCLIGFTFSILIGLLLILILLRLLMDYWMTNEEICNIDIFQANLCRAFRRKELTGNLCKDICSYNDKQFHFLTPVKKHSGKQFVYEANWLGRPVFIKAKTINFTSAFESNVPLPRNLKIYLQNSLQEKGIPPQFYANMDLMEVLWSGKRKHYSAAMKKSLVALLNQQEYVISKLFHDFHVFPEVYGSCGHIYAVEKVKPITSMYLPRIPANFKYRILIALKIIEFLYFVDVLSQSSMYFCDVKFDHLGINNRKEIRFLDLDTIEFEKRVLDSMRYYHEKNSSCEESCSFFDCTAKCDEACYPFAMKNNIQIFINNIFRRGDEVSGLLQNPSSEYLNEVRYIFNNCTMDDLEGAKNFDMVLSSIKRIINSYNVKVL